MGEVLLRPMRVDDVEEAERLSDDAFGASDEALGHEVSRRGQLATERWIRRTLHFLRTDAAGCWVAEEDGAMVGFATSLRRDLVWILPTYAVRPGRQGAGIGRPLLEAALTHSRGCLRGMLSASSDPRAFRRYRAAGFSLHPTFTLTGEVDRTALPVVDHVREGSASDVDLMDSLDRQRREAAHGSDHLVMLRDHRLLVVDHTTGSGYAYLDDQGHVTLLAASNRRTAARLLWESLASAPPGATTRLRHVTTANEWALDVGLAARLVPETRGYLALRGMRPPTPYLHHGALL